MSREIINDITTVTVAGKSYSAIVIGEEEKGIPKHLLQAERRDGVIVDGENLYAFPWLGVTSDGIYQYLYFDSCSLEPIETITTTNRANALNLVEEIAYGLLNVERSFLNLESGYFPLYRIYILDKTKIVLLPPDAADILAIARMGERRKEELYYLLKKGTEKSYTLVLEMAELLYWASSGVLPFNNEKVRTADLNAIPLFWYEKSLGQKTENFISTILDSTEKDQRKNGGNKRAEENLSWFLSESSKLDWNLKNITLEERNEKIERLEKEKEFIDYYNKANKRAGVKDFWRLKGTLIITISLVVIVVGILLGNYIFQALKAPSTKDLAPQELIVEIYNMQNRLDAGHFNDAVKGELPQSSEVINLYVNKQTRMAYEQLDPLVKAPDWISSGKPDIMETAFIYGVVLDKIEQINDNEWEASGTWYTPYAYDKTEDENGEYTPPEGYIPVYVYEITQKFYIKYNSRGWYEITDSEITKYNFKGRELVKTYPKAPIQL